MMIDEHHLVVPRMARYYTVGSASPGTKRVWIACHGYAQLARDFLRDFAPLDDGSTLVVAPEGLSRTYMRGSDGRVGASWMTREDRLNEIDDYVRYLDMLSSTILTDIGTAEPELTILGFSQGTATAGRWLALGTVQPHRLILCGGLLPPDPPLVKAMERLRTTEVVFSVGTEDTLVDRAGLAQQYEALNSAGVRCRLAEFTGGHVVDIAGLAAS